MDPQIEELKNLVRRQSALIEDTNRILHKMRRGVWWGRFFLVLWWVLIFAVSGAAYYYYLQPYLAKAEQLYGEVQSNGAKAQSLEEQIQNFLQHPLSAVSGQ